MNLNPMTWLRAKFNNPGGLLAGAQREVDAMGPWSPLIGSFVPRQVNPHLYEALRESIGLIDGGIETLVTLDGIVRVRGDNDALVAEIEDWMESVPVNDGEAGLQAFYASQGNEVYEQGFNVGEWVLSRDKRDIAGLRVADSKGLLFLRTDKGLETYYRPPGTRPGNHPTGLDSVESVLRRTGGLTLDGLQTHGYTPLKRDRLVYVVHSPEADNPYGTSKLRSLEFVSQILLRIENAVGRSWERYGDPPLHLSYKTKNAKLSQEDLEARKRNLQAALASALKSKTTGNSVDLVTAVGALDEVLVNVIGANGFALQPAEPMKVLREDISAKFGIPMWLMGLDGGAGGGQAERQSEMVLQASKTRWERRKPGLSQLVATQLRLRGRTWKRGDWFLEQELPNLQDMMKVAQAKFLLAQAEMVGQGNGSNERPRGIDNNLRAPRSGARTKGTKAASDNEGEPWAESDPNLPRIEREQTERWKGRWWALAEEVAALLGMRVVDRVFAADGDAPFAFDAGQFAPLLALGERFRVESHGEDAPLLRATWEAWVRGWINAGEEIDADPAIDDYRELVRQQLLTRGGELITSAVGRAYRTRVVAELASGAFDGVNPATVAATLQRKFEAGEYDWERLVRSEMAIAQSRGKREMYRANGYELYDYTTAEDGRVSRICRELAAAGPYPVGRDSSPIPVVDSHPNCRCSLAPHVAA